MSGGTHNVVSGLKPMYLYLYTYMTDKVELCLLNIQGLTKHKLMEIESNITI